MIPPWTRESMCWDKLII